MLETITQIFVPDSAGALWIGMLVAIVIFADLAQLRSRRNAALAALFVMAGLLLDIMRFEDHGGSRVATWAFTAVYLGTAGYAFWGLVLSRRGTPVKWTPNLNRQALKLVLGLVVILTTIVTVGRRPDDAGYYTNLGARRWVETGILPYADAKLKGPNAPAYGAAATYGPLLYLSHIPFQWLTLTKSNPPDATPILPSYIRPPVLATQLAVLTFFFAGLWGLFTVVKRYDGEDTALGVTALYGASPYILGLGGGARVIGGLAFASHIAPSSVMLLAFASLGKPVLAGALLAASAGVLFYPVFVFPAWFGWYLSRNRKQAMEFLAGFAVVGIAIALVVIIFTPTEPGSNAISVFLESTLEHQEGVSEREYGGSVFGFWGTHPRLASFWQEPLAGSGSLLKPTFIVYALAALSAFFFAHGRTAPQLAGLTAALTAGVQLWKTHAAGSYVEWYMPFLLIALFCGANLATAPAPEPEPPNG